ncbi:putative protein K02A2.6-like [Crotalus adamanteus]|uniref:Integrase catalytic domain-containing protein n=1 Tax=Crotalus adamanteus TaxID=8729 RepID=A0AAW1AUX8_CROAD
MIHHATSAPFHPSTNGMAERMVRITKDALKKLTYGDWHHRVTGPLSYEVSLDNGRVLRRHIDQLRPRWDLPAETPGSFPRGEGDPFGQREGLGALQTVPGRCKLPGTRQAVASTCAHAQVLARQKLQIDPGMAYKRGQEFWALSASCNQYAEPKIKKFLRTTTASRVLPFREGRNTSHQKILVMPNMDDIILPLMHSGLESHPLTEGSQGELPAEDVRNR